MNFKQFQYVLALNEAGSFSKAANVLNISQPSLSQYIKKIEDDLGIVLFERTNGNVRLTDAGYVYIDAGRKILDLENQMKSRFFDIGKDKSGSLTVGTTPYRSAAFMPKIVARFREKYKGIVVIIKEFETHELIERAEQGEFDLCFTALPVDEKQFDYVEVMEEEFVIAVPTGTSLDSKLKMASIAVEGRKYRAVDVKLLDKEEFITVGETQIMQRYFDDLCFDYGIDIKPVITVKSMETQIKMVCEGLGAALVTVGVERIFNADYNVSYYSILQDLPRRKIGAVYCKNKYVSKPLKYMVDLMKEC